jgi:uncharacterized protein YdeI (YjbR/CyaY-like superfamily)
MPNDIPPPFRLKRELQPMPLYVEEALASAGLMAAYQSRPPYQRNDYLSWINRAKLAPTRQKRLDQMLAELAAGDRYMNMAWQPGVAGSSQSND